MHFRGILCHLAQCYLYILCTNHCRLVLLFYVIHLPRSGITKSYSYLEINRILVLTKYHGKSLQNQLICKCNAVYKHRWSGSILKVVIHMLNYRWASTRLYKEKLHMQLCCYLTVLIRDILSKFRVDCSIALWILREWTDKVPSLKKKQTPKHLC